MALFSASSAYAEIVYEGEPGKLMFGGDVELDINSYNTQSGPIFTEDNIETNDEYNQSGRILLDVSGERTHRGNFARFKVQPLMQTDGTFGLDDSWFAFGNDTGLEAKVGRFEAFDLFPLGQDVFVEYNGDTSDSLYSDGQGYIYQAKEGRGRSGDAGQVLVSKASGDLYAEVSTLFGDRTDLFQGGTYHGFTIQEDSKNAFIIRPVLAWTPGSWTLAAGAETNLVDDAIVDERGQDISERDGYGTRLSYSEGAWSLNANLAYMDAHDEENLTLGLNMLWHNFGLGYIHARNEIQNVKVGSSVEFASGDYDVDTLYTSYRFPEVLGIEGFDIYLGAYYSQIDHEEISNLDEADRYGGRLRFKYLF
nr:carbohydrate porin [Halomonas cerina]